jgi:hypothetical protein
MTAARSCSSVCFAECIPFGQAENILAKTRALPEKLFASRLEMAEYTIWIFAKTTGSARLA